MQVKHLIELLQEMPPDARVVLHNVYEPDFFALEQLQERDLKPCEIYYPHVYRDPKLVKPATPESQRLPAVFIGISQLPR